MAAPLQFHSPQAAVLLNMVQQIRAYERLPEPDQVNLQNTQLHKLLRHARQYSPFWQQRLVQAAFDPTRLDRTILQRLPVLQRAEVQNHAESLRARWPGLKEEQISVSATSGSTGIPVRVEKASHLYGLVYAATSWIESEWHGRDATRKIAVLVPGIQNGGSATWGGAYEALNIKGPSVFRGLQGGTMASHLQWLQKEKPAYLKCGPVVATELARLAIAQGVQISLQQIISQSERVTQRQREQCMEAFGAPIIDRYSSEETGWIALQCPSHHKLHVLNASVLLEIVDDEGRPCAPGVMGRVLVTSLHSLAMPIIRYDIGDLAEWGQSCGCGMTLPVLARLWGRIRHQVRLPDGSLIPMAFLGDELGKLEVMQAFRILQYRGSDLEIRVQSNGELSDSDRQAIREVFIRNGMGDLPLHIRTVQDMGWGTMLKREEFLRLDTDFAEVAACPSI